jgi:tetratricopeptide (TPR) repeat protein
MRRWQPLIALVAAIVVSSCAQRSANPAAPAAAAVKADELVLQGCYDCLLDARAEYERLASRSPSAALRLFEVNLLLALREKELSLDSTDSLARASALASRLTAIAADSVITAVKTMPSDAAGKRPLISTPAATKELDATIAAIDASALSATLKNYLRLSLQCGRVAQPPAPAAPTDAAPLIAYRRAICDNPVKPEPLRAVRMSVPRFVETSFYLGRAAMASLFRTDGSQARQLFEEAYARFPASPSIAFDLGTVHQATGDCRRADTLFTRVLELSPAHEEARLGRTICRTYLSRTDEAIADATVLIDAAASNRADAYYWRAWNRRRASQIETARADIDQARALRYNARVLTLAGMIEYDQTLFDKARDDLERARDLDPRECDAPQYLGLLEYRVEAWAASARGFAAAAECYTRLIKDTEAQRAAMAARDDVSEEFRARQIAGFDAAIADDSVQRSAAELNAAINYGRAGDIPNATIYMKRAAVDPQRRSAVEDLRQVLGVPRW